MKLINNPKRDNDIVEWQKRFYNYFDRHFSFNKSLCFAILVGCLGAFIGSDCYGSIDLYSPLAVLLIATVGFSSLQVILFIKMPVIRIAKFATVLTSSYLLTKEFFALWSIKIMDIKNACRPYLYTDEPIGYLWIIAPMIAIICWCFANNKEEKLTKYLESEPEEAVKHKDSWLKSLIVKLKVGIKR